MRGVTQRQGSAGVALAISTHTPHARRDFSMSKKYVTYFVFQLTRLMRGVTNEPHNMLFVCFISTHTPHARRDMVKKVKYNPNGFQLTRLMRGVTLGCDYIGEPIFNFNSHASCEA